jgi:hypothetical protein
MNWLIHHHFTACQHCGLMCRPERAAERAAKALGVLLSCLIQMTRFQLLNQPTLANHRATAARHEGVNLPSFVIA